MKTVLHGQAAAPGIAIAPGFVIEVSGTPSESIPKHRQGSAEEELSRAEEALAGAERELRSLTDRVTDEMGRDEAKIFEVHAQFTADPELRDRVAASIDGGASAERAVVDAFGSFRDLLAASDSEYLAARVADLDDVRDRVLEILQGVDRAGVFPEEASVVIAHTLTPSQTADIPREVIAAIVTATGSPTSHAAILARALGVPAVVGAREITEAVRPETGVDVAVDGWSGEVVVDPGPEDRARFESRMMGDTERRRRLAQLRDVPGATADGHQVELAANIGTHDDIPLATEAGAEGSGLVRTEFLFVDRMTAPSVEEQVEFYRQVAGAFPDQRVVFRTLDAGADKPLPFVDREPEPNPALGLRGIRFSLSRPELLRDQLRALLRTSVSLSEEQAGRIAIMFPLVSVPKELLAALEILEAVAEEEGVGLSDIEVGAMIEVPMAALASDRVARYADFLSIGTNDLLQYLFAADRLVGEVARLSDLCEPEVLSLLEGVVEAGHRHDAWVGVCGEAASDPALAVALVGLGVDELSMTGAALPEVKDALRHITLDTCRRLARAAMGATSSTEAREILEQGLGR